MWNRQSLFAPLLTMHFLMRNMIPSLFCCLACVLPPAKKAILQTGMRQVRRQCDICQPIFDIAATAVNLVRAEDWQYLWRDRPATRSNQVLIDLSCAFRAAFSSDNCCMVHCANIMDSAPSDMTARRVSGLGAKHMRNSKTNDVHSTRALKRAGLDSPRCSTVFPNQIYRTEKPLLQGWFMLHTPPHVAQ